MIDQISDVLFFALGAAFIVHGCREGNGVEVACALFLTSISGYNILHWAKP